MTNRRGFFGGLLAMLGFGGLVKAAEPVEQQVKGFIIFYINVGQLPPVKAETLVERYKERLIKEDVRKKLHNWEFLYIPTRTDPTRVEIMYLDPQAATADIFNEKDLEPANSKDFVYPEYEVCKDYTLLMLGAPALQVELDEAQLKTCYDLARMSIKEAIETKGFTILEEPGVLKNTLQGLMLARAKMILGMVCSKSWTQWGRGAELREEGNNELLEYEDRLRQL